MITKKSIVSAVAAAAFSAALAGSAIGEAPTFSGTLICIHEGETIDLNPLSGAPKKEVNWWSRYWADNGYCERGMVDSSGLTKDA